jgi:gingipain R
MAVWYVLSAWAESKEWRGVQFGLGTYDADDFAITQYGPCFPSQGMVLPTSGWPGPDEGIALTAMDTTWVGNFQPVYWFAGYVYGEGLIPLAEDPASAFVGWANIENTEFEAEGLGGIGLFMDGIAACPQCEVLRDAGLAKDEDAELEVVEDGDDFIFNLGGEATEVSVIEADTSHTVLEITVGQFRAHRIQIDDETYFEVSLDSEGLLEERGLPALPQVRRGLIIPDDQHMTATILEGTYVDVPGVPVAPSKGNPAVDGNLDSLSYVFDPRYDSGCAWPEGLVGVDPPDIIRDFRVATAWTIPFRYYPHTKTLRVFTRLQVEVAADGPDSVSVFERTHPLDRIDAQFAKLYEDNFINFNAWLNQLREYPILDEDGPLLIITANAYASELEEFVTWKRQRGLETTVTTMSEIPGNPPTAEDLATYIAEQYYEHEENPIAYVLLVGDLEQVPSLWVEPPPLWIWWTDGFSDPRLADPVDNHLPGYAQTWLPDLFIGRFSASSPCEVRTQARRSIEYERDLGPEATWLDHVLGISTDTAMPEGNNLQMDTRLEVLSAAGGYQVTRVSQEDHGDPLPTSVVSDPVNEGCGLMLYSDHGHPGGWKADFIPFLQQHVQNLTNANMLPFVVCHACECGMFSEPECFAETWMRTSQGEEPCAGAPEGAIAVCMASADVYYGYMQQAQDKLAQLVAQSALTPGEAMYTLGGLFYNSEAYMEVTWKGSWLDMERWTLFGDPTLVFRTAAPEAMTVTHDGVLFPNQSTYTVHVSPNGDARCTLYANGTICGSTRVDEAGDAEIPLVSPPSWPTGLTLTVVGHNRVTYQDVVRPACLVLADGTGNFDTIEEAVGAANDETIIFLGDGSFSGLGNVDVDCYGKNVTIRSQSGDPSQCEIDCDGNEENTHRWIWFAEGQEAHELRIEGVGVRNAYVNSSRGGAISADPGALHLVNCRFESNESGQAGGAIFCNGALVAEECGFFSSRAEEGGAIDVSGSAVLSGCTMVANGEAVEGRSCWGGALRAEGDLSMTKCTLWQNYASSSGAVELHGTFSATVDETIISSTTYGSAVSIDDEGVGTVTLSCCDLFGNDGGDWVGEIADQLGQRNNISLDPEFCFASEWNFMLIPSSPCGPRHYGCQEGMGAWPVSMECEPSGSENETPIPEGYVLSVQTPCRAGEGARIQLGIPAAGTKDVVELRVQDLTGRMIRRIGLGHMPPGMHAVAWDGADDNGRQVPAGVYFCHLATGDRLIRQRLVMVR